MPRMAKYSEIVKNLDDLQYINKKYLTLPSTEKLFSLLEETIDSLFPPKDSKYFGKFVDIKDVDKFIKGEW